MIETPAIPPSPVASRAHLARLMKVWRSGGWPSRDALEIDLLAAGWVQLCRAETGHETLRLTDAGIDLLAAARQRNQRAASAHDQLADKVAQQMMDAGRIAWRELSLRAQVTTTDAPPADLPKTAWRIARPDVFSVRNTSVEAYLQPIVHEVKVSRADLLSDLRHAAKRVARNHADRVRARAVVLGAFQLLDYGRPDARELRNICRDAVRAELLDLANERPGEAGRGAVAGSVVARRQRGGNRQGCP